MGDCCARLYRPVSNTSARTASWRIDRCIRETPGETVATLARNEQTLLLLGRGWINKERVAGVAGRRAPLVCRRQKHRRPRESQPGQMLRRGKKPLAHV